MDGTLVINTSSSDSYNRSVLTDRYAGQQHRTPPAYFSNEFDIVLLAGNILWSNEFDSPAATIKTEGVNNNIILEKSWISFAISLFPNARYFTKEEQEAFENYKRKHFKKFKLNF